MDENNWFSDSWRHPRPHRHSRVDKVEHVLQGPLIHGVNDCGGEPLAHTAHTEAQSAAVGSIGERVYASVDHLIVLDVNDALQAVHLHRAVQCNEPHHRGAGKIHVCSVV